MRTIITGAASGIGSALASRLASKPGAKLLLTDRDTAALEDVAQSLAGHAEVVTFAGDLAEVSTAAAIVAHCVGTYGGVDAIASNAGAMKGMPLEELEPGDFDFLFRVNTRPTWLLGRAALPWLKESRGAIVATASLAAEHATPPLGTYSASKAALVMLIRQMALEWGRYSIRCNAVSPGPTLTAMSAEGYADPTRRREREQATPLRQLGTTDHSAAAIAFLLGPDAAHITGQNLTVDGGLGQALMVLSGSGTGQNQPG